METLKEEETEEKEEVNKGSLSEKSLYPYFEQWLFEIENERVADISSNRSQGRWANPDLVGIIFDYLEVYYKV
ncbi:MAG: hypothetical protein GDA42_11995 [Ekhidna sp.]|nr:hypothetical protein [Ekhidna sp.]MBC6411149.1 hypothetical protein [Ekhidna sp.]